jgi:ABC-type amino acid transport substrate-binding protein
MLRRLGCGLSAGLLLAAACPAQEVSLRTVQQASSIVKYDPDGAPQRTGLCMEVLRAVERADPGLRFTGLEQVMPLKRVERLLADGQIDAFFCLLRSAERERQWRYVPVPLYAVRHVIAQRVDDTHGVDSLLDLATISQVKPVLVTRGSVLGRKLETIGVNLAEVGSEREALQMLVLGRTDAIYGQDINLTRHIRDAHLADKVRLGRTVFQEDAQFLAVRHDLPAAIVDRLTEALRRLEREGVLRLLSEKYR